MAGQVKDVLAERTKRAAILEHAGSLSIEDLTDAMNEGGIETADGCWVEPDGECEHGFPSPLIPLGYI